MCPVEARCLIKTSLGLCVSNSRILEANELSQDSVCNKYAVVSVVHLPPGLERWTMLITICRQLRFYTNTKHWGSPWAWERFIVWHRQIAQLPRTNMLAWPCQFPCSSERQLWKGISQVCTIQGKYQRWCLTSPPVWYTGSIGSSGLHRVVKHCVYPCLVANTPRGLYGPLWAIFWKYLINVSC